MILLMEEEAVEIAKSVLSRCLEDQDFYKLNFGGQITVLGTVMTLLGMDYLSKDGKKKE